MEKGARHSSAACLENCTEFGVSEIKRPKPREKVRSRLWLRSVLSSWTLPLKQRGAPGDLEPLKCQDLNWV